MKFTKEQLLDYLKGKLTENGKHLSISEKTIKSQCDNLFDLLVKDDDELDDIGAKLLPQFVSLNGNYEKDNADFIKKWKSEHQENKKSAEGNTSGNENKEDDAVSKLLERIQKLEERDAQAQHEKLIAGKRNELLAKFKEKGIKDSKWADKYLGKLSLSENSDIEKEADDALEFYNLSHASGNKRTPGTAASGEPDEDTDWSDVISIVSPDAGD